MPATIGAPGTPCASCTAVMPARSTSVETAMHGVRWRGVTVWLCKTCVPRFRHGRDGAVVRGLVADYWRVELAGRAGYQFGLAEPRATRTRLGAAGVAYCRAHPRPPSETLLVWYAFQCGWVGATGRLPYQAKQPQQPARKRVEET